MRKSVMAIIVASIALCASGAASAQSADGAAGSALPTSDAADRFARFVPKETAVTTHIDYSIWDEALNFFVFHMGRSIREGAPTVDPGAGTRRIYGHDSRYRLEGNRVIFSYLDEDVIHSLTEYREDLQRVAGQLDIASLPRNEQLAYWINLHNVAVIEQIALAYPLSQPSRLMIGDPGVPLDEARFITVDGVKMSPKDIRTRIVYLNWHDPKVIYGFFRGEIGGPSIQDEAFTAQNLGDLLEGSAREFVNSLRGTEKRGDTLYVSQIYAEARPFYFAGGDAALAAHLRKYANDEVAGLIDRTSRIEASTYEFDIADLSKGEREPSYSNIQYLDQNGDLKQQQTRIPANIQRLVMERNQKLNKLIRHGERVGKVTVIDVDLPDDSKEPEEVE